MKKETMKQECDWCLRACEEGETHTSWNRGGSNTNTQKNGKFYTHKWGRAEEVEEEKANCGGNSNR